MPKRSVPLRQILRSASRQVWVIPAVVIIAMTAVTNVCAGEPAADFLSRLRASGYFDSAIKYLDRLDQYPGVDPEFASAAALEKGQTYIDAAAASRSTTTRDEFLQTATSQLQTFLDQGSHPRQSEARLLLGRLQMVRAGQLLAGEPNEAERTEARESYRDAAATFDAITENLRAKLKEMQGGKIDATREPEKAALRDQYRGEFLQGLASSGDARFEAAKTYTDPAKDGKKELDEALVIFTDLSEKYDEFPPGAIAMLSRGLVQEMLGQNDKALDSFIRMLEFQDFDPLREAKIQATTGFVRLSMAEKPPRFQSAIDRGEGMISSIRPNERRTPIVLDLQLALAEAYLAKSKDKDNQKPVDLKRAESEGRQLLTKTSKVAGPQADRAKALLAEMGITIGDDEPEAMPTTADPTSLEDAYAKSIDLYQSAETLTQSLAELGDDAAATSRRNELQSQLDEARRGAMQILSRGLSMVNSKTDGEVASSARQLLSVLLYQDGRLRDAAVVGRFLAQNSPGTDVGMKGAVISRNSLQNLLVADLSNEAIADQLKDLAGFAISIWPADPETDVFRRLLVELELQNDNWDAARDRIASMPESPNKALMLRKLGLFLWQASYAATEADDDAAAQTLLQQARQELQSGLDAISGQLADADAMKSALVLAKINLKLGDTDGAAKVLDNSKYGPVKLAEKFATDDEVFASDLYRTELNILVARMTAPGSDTAKLTERASAVMDKLRSSVSGDDAEQRLTAIYLRLAADIQEQLETASPQQKTKLIQAFRVFLDRIAQSTKEPATLEWIGQTTIQLAEASMAPGETLAKGQSAELLETAVATLTSLKESSNEPSSTIDFQLGRAQRLQGEYGAAVKTLKDLLKREEMKLDAQIEIALAYEQWAMTPNFRFAAQSFKTALGGTMTNPKTKKNIVWGWGRISQLTSGRPEFQEKFFEARYHVALCRYLWGKAAKEKSLIEKSVSDINQVAALYPSLGGPEQRQKFDQLLKLIQKELGVKPEGLPPLKANDS